MGLMERLRFFKHSTEIMYWQFNRLSDQIKKRKNQDKCERCLQLYDKELNVCPHCADLTDHELEEALLKRATTRSRMSKIMFIAAAILLILLIFING